MILHQRSAQIEPLGCYVHRFRDPGHTILSYLMMIIENVNWKIYLKLKRCSNVLNIFKLYLAQSVCDYFDYMFSLIFLINSLWQIVIEIPKATKLSSTVKMNYLDMKPETRWLTNCWWTRVNKWNIKTRLSNTPRV